MHVCFRECGVCIQCAWVFTLRIKSTCFQDDTLASVLWLLHCCYFFSSPEDQLYQVMWHKNVNSFICYDQVTENLSHASVVLQYKTTFWVKAGETAFLVSCYCKNSNAINRYNILHYLVRRSCRDSYWWMDCVCVCVCTYKMYYICMEEGVEKVVKEWMQS